MMAGRSERRVNFAAAEILSLSTDSEITGFSIAMMAKRGFPDSTIQAFIKLKESQESNQELCDNEILKGRQVKLPPQDPIVAMAEFQKRKISNLSQPIENVKIDLVVDAQTSDVKGYQFTLDGIPLEQWCKQRDLNFDIYQKGLQSYIEVDVLGQLNVAIINNQLVYIDPNTRESKILTYEELAKKLNNQSISLNGELEKQMKAHNIVQNKGVVAFALQKFGKVKERASRLKSEQGPKPGVD